MIVIPAVDVLDGAVVRLMHGSYEEVTRYGDAPRVVAQRWADLGASIIHAVDLEGARSATPSRRLWRDLGDTGVPFQIGGGIRNQALAAEAVGAGASRVVVGSVAVHDEETLSSIVRAVGSDRVVAAVDVRDGRARGSGWLDEGVDVATVIERVVEAGVGTALVTGIDRDGAMGGPNTDVLETVRSLAPDLALIASGGVGSLDDLRVLRDGGYEAVVVGRALYEDRFTLEEAIAVAIS